MPLLLSKELLVTKIKQWDTDWMLFWLAAFGQVTLTYDKAQHLWTCTWTPDNLPTYSATDDCPTAASSRQVLQKVALLGLDANYEWWAARHEPD